MENKKNTLDITYTYYDFGRKVAYKILGNENGIMASLVDPKMEDEKFPKEIKFWMENNEIKYYPVKNNEVLQQISVIIEKEIHDYNLSSKMGFLK